MSNELFAKNVLAKGYWAFKMHFEGKRFIEHNEEQIKKTYNKNLLKHFWNLFLVSHKI